MEIDSAKGLLHVTHDEVLTAINRLPVYDPNTSAADDHQYLQLLSAVFAGRFSMDELRHLVLADHTEAVPLSPITRRLFEVEEVA